jgi:hypothetical protein
MNIELEPQYVEYIERYAEFYEMDFIEAFYDILGSFIAAHPTFFKTSNMITVNPDSEVL